MKNIKCKVSQIGLAVSLAATMMLTACGGGGSGYESKNDNYKGQDLRRTVKGVAVDGLVKGAEVTLYVLDPNATDWKGQQLAKGTTDDNGRFKDVVIPTGQFSYKAYIVEVKDTSGSELLPVMTGIVKRFSMIDLSETVYVTPVSTLLTEYAYQTYKDNPAAVTADLSDDDKVAFADLQENLKDRFGLGLIGPNTDLTTQPVIFTQNVVLTGANKSKDDVVKDEQEAMDLRLVNEVLLSAVKSIKDSGVAGTPTEILKEIALDQVDGQPDLKNNGVPINNILAGVDLKTVYLANLYKSKDQIASTPLVDGSGDVSSVQQMMQKELAANNVSGITVETLPAPTDVDDFKGLIPGDVDGTCVKSTFEAGYCANAAPVVQTATDLIVAPSATLKLEAVINDADTLDEVAVVGWKVVNPPADGYTISDVVTTNPDASKKNVVNTQASFSAITNGVYKVVLTVKDNVQTVETPITVEVKGEAPNNVAPVINSMPEAKNYHDLSNGTLIPLVATATDANAGDKIKATWACTFQRHGSFPAEAVELTEVNNLSTAIKVKPYEGVYNCQLDVTDGFKPAEAKTVQITVDKDQPKTAALFGFSVAALAWFGLRRRKKA